MVIILRWIESRFDAEFVLFISVGSEIFIFSCTKGNLSFEDVAIVFCFRNGSYLCDKQYTFSLLMFQNA